MEGKDKGEFWVGAHKESFKTMPFTLGVNMTNTLFDHHSGTRIEMKKW